MKETILSYYCKKYEFVPSCFGRIFSLKKHYDFVWPLVRIVWFVNLWQFRFSSLHTRSSERRPHSLTFIIISLLFWETSLTFILLSKLRDTTRDNWIKPFKYSLFTFKSHKSKFKNFINEKFRKWFYFLTCILPDNVPHESSKDVFENINF